MRALLERASAGSGSLLIVEGPAGIGKSRLLAEAGALADGIGLHVPIVTCSAFWRGDEDARLGVSGRRLAYEVFHWVRVDKGLYVTDNHGGLADPRYGMDDIRSSRRSSRTTRSSTTTRTRTSGWQSTTHASRSSWAS